MACHVVGASAGAGAGGGGDDGKDNRDVRRLFEASYDNLNMLNHPAPEACPRCKSKDFKFGYFNNGSLSQPRFLCKTCKRGWTQGGAIHDVPVGGRKRKRVVPTVVPAADIPASGREQEQVMAPPMPMPMPMPIPMPMEMSMPMPDFSGIIEAGLSMMRMFNENVPLMPNNLMLNYHQEFPSFYPVTTTTTTGWSSMVESSVNVHLDWNFGEIVPPPPPPPPQPMPQPQAQPQQQPEVVSLDHDDIDDDFNKIMEWSIEDLLASDDEFNDDGR